MMKNVLHKHLARVVGIALFVGLSGFSTTTLAGPCGADEVFVVDRVIITPTETYYLGHCEENKNHKPSL